MTGRASGVRVYAWRAALAVRSRRFACQGLLRYRSGAAWLAAGWRRVCAIRSGTCGCRPECAESCRREVVFRSVFVRTVVGGGGQGRAKRGAANP